MPNSKNYYKFKQKMCGREETFENQFAAGIKY